MSIGSLGRNSHQAQGVGGLHLQYSDIKNGASEEADWVHAVGQRRQEDANGKAVWNGEWRS